MTSAELRKRDEQLDAALDRIGTAPRKGPRPVVPWVSHGKTMGKPWENGEKP